MHNKEDAFETVEEEILRRPSLKSWCPQKREKGKTLPYPVQMRIENPPVGWVGNYRKDHDIEADPCMCQHCYISKYPFLEARDPVQVHPQYPIETPAMQLVVGLYDSRITKRSVVCDVCTKLIEITESFDVGVEVTAVHVACLPEEEQNALGRIGYAIPYVIDTWRA